MIITRIRSTSQHCKSILFNVRRLGGAGAAAEMCASASSGMSSPHGKPWQVVPGSTTCGLLSVLLTLECGQVFGWNRGAAVDSAPQAGAKRPRQGAQPPGSPSKRRKTTADSAIVGVSPKAIGVLTNSRAESALVALSGLDSSTLQGSVFQPIEYTGVVRHLEGAPAAAGQTHSLVRIRTARGGYGMEMCVIAGETDLAGAALRRQFRIGEVFPDQLPKVLPGSARTAFYQYDELPADSVSGSASAVSGGSGTSAAVDVMESLNYQWAAADERHKVLGASLPGLRVLRQDPVECLFSFICSSNNNIPRINLILARLRARYGALVGEFEGKEYYSFPTIESLAAAEESDLRAIGLGYRARFIRDTAKHLVQVGGRRFLESLAALPVSRESRIKVQEEMCKCVGVGRKVADCVALFSMGRCDAVPVDTHVWTMACRDFRAGTLPPLPRAEKGGAGSSGASVSASATYATGSAAATATSTSSSEAGQEQPQSPVGKRGRKKAPLPLLRSSEELYAAASLTPRVYESVGELFRGRFGSHAGWAHCVMFAAELPAFRRWLPKDMADEISRFEEDERKRNKERKEAAKERTAARKKAKEGAGDAGKKSVSGGGQAASATAGDGSER